MNNRLITNIKVNIKFYRRNRLLIVTSIFIIGVLGLSMIPTLFFLTKTKHLETIRAIFSQLSSFATIVTAGLGLLFISYHVRNRATKMVFTKPCSPDIWLLSGLLSASFVAFIFYTGILLVCSLLFFAWNIPFQWGILYVTLNEFVQTLIVLSYITFLTVMFHPVIAVFFILIFQEGTFYYIKLLLMSVIKATGDGLLSAGLKIAKWFVDIIYMLMPTYSPFSEKMSPVYSSFRVSADSWKYLALALAYALVVSGLLYLLSLYFLKKKRHI